jgi:hypothetical protein
MCLMNMDFVVTGPLVPHGHASYPVLVHRLVHLLHASFRPRLAATPLRFANPSPPSGWVEDLHLLAVKHVRRTRTVCRRQAAEAPDCFADARRLVRAWGPPEAAPARALCAT